MKYQVITNIVVKGFNILKLIFYHHNQYITQLAKHQRFNLLIKYNYNLVILQNAFNSDIIANLEFKCMKMINKELKQMVLPGDKQTDITALLFKEKCIIQYSIILSQDKHQLQC